MEAIIMDVELTRKRSRYDEGWKVECLLPMVCKVHMSVLA